MCEYGIKPPAKQGQDCGFRECLMHINGTIMEYVKKNYRKLRFLSGGADQEDPKFTPEQATGTAEPYKWGNNHPPPY